MSAVVMGMQNSTYLSLEQVKRLNPEFVTYFSNDGQAIQSAEKFKGTRAIRFIEDGALKFAPVPKSELDHAAGSTRKGQA